MVLQEEAPDGTEYIQSAYNPIWKEEIRENLMMFMPSNKERGGVD